jgi:hypothetical protein
MKKLLFLPLALILGVSISFYACSDDDDDDDSSGVDCVQIAQEISDAATAWAADPTNSSLQDAYCDALDEGLEKCADSSTATAWEYALTGANCGSK